GSADDVVINLVNPNVTVSHASGADTVHSLVSNAMVALSGGSLSVATTAQVTNTFTLSGGTLAGATIVAGTNLTGTGSGGTLTSGPGITVHGGTGTIGYNPNYGGPSNVSVVNQGNILADSAGTLTINGTSWTNPGTIQASNAANLTLSGSWSSSGTIAI